MRSICFAFCSTLVAWLALSSVARSGEPRAETEYFRVEVRGELRVRELWFEPDHAFRQDRAPDREWFTIRVGQKSWRLLLDAKAVEAARNLRGKRVDVSGSLEPDGIRVKGLKETGGK